MAVLPTLGTVFDLYSVANRGLFISAQITGDGTAQSTAHGLGRTPVAVWFVVDDNDNAKDIPVTYGTHDGTNVILTITASAIYRVFAF